MPDWGLHGAGLHGSSRGRHLTVHSDFIYRRNTKTRRVLNLLLYLNSEWKDEWNGHIELWDKKNSYEVDGIVFVGSSSISTVTNVRLFVDADGDGVLDQNEIDNSVDYDGNFDPSIEAKITISLGAASIEYVMPVFQDLEISAGAMMGLGRMNLSIDQYAANPKWTEMFDFSYGPKVPGVDADSNSTVNYYYAVDNLGNPISGFNAANAPGVMSDLSGTFF